MEMDELQADDDEALSGSSRQITDAASANTPHQALGKLFVRYEQAAQHNLAECYQA